MSSRYANKCGVLTQRERGGASWHHNGSGSSLLVVMGRRTLHDPPPQPIDRRSGGFGQRSLEGCLEELAESTRKLDDEGFLTQLRAQVTGHLRWTLMVNPASGKVGSVGVSSVSDSHFRTRTLLLHRTAARRAHLRSHSGRNAGAALAHAPTAPENTIPPHLFRTLILERLQLPLQITESLCEGCQGPLDPLGRHRASCTCSGRIKKRATPTERTAAHLPRSRSLRGTFSSGT